MNIFQKIYSNLYSDNFNMTSRIPLFDNAKFILIFLVVFTHMLLTIKIQGNDNVKIITEISYTAKTLYYFIYIFLMPSFFMVTGYFSKQRYKKERIIGIVVLYIIFQTVYIIFDKLVLRNNVTSSYFSPRTVLYYLFLIAVFTLILPIITMNFKPVVAIIITIFIAVISGYDSSIGFFLALSKIFNFLPFFLVGFYLNQNKNNLKKFLTIKYRIAAFFVFLTLLILCIFFKDSFDHRLLHCTYSYEAINIIPYGGIYRIIYYIFSFTAIFSFFILTPTKKTIFTDFGSRSLTVYILHMFLFNFALKYAAPISFKSELGYIIIIVATLLFSMALTLLLSKKLLSKPLDYIIKGEFKNIYNKY